MANEQKRMTDRWREDKNPCSFERDPDAKPLQITDEATLKALAALGISVGKSEDSKGTRFDRIEEKDN